MRSPRSRPARPPSELAGQIAASPAAAPAADADTRPAPGPRASSAGLPLDPRAALLLWGSPGQILARLGPGDPLALGQRTRRRVRERALLIDARLLLPRVRALVARRAFDWRGDPPLEEFLDGAIEAALDAWLAEASELHSAGGSALVPRRLAAFARLPEPVRRAFIAALLDGRRLDALAAERGQDLSSLARDLRQAIDLLVPPPSLPRAPG
jgi:hypothetical protein